MTDTTIDDSLREKCAAPDDAAGPRRALPGRSAIASAGIERPPAARFHGSARQLI